MNGALMANPTGSIGCQEGLAEVVRGLTGLMAALFIFAWSGFDWAIILFGVAILLTGGRLSLRQVGAESARIGLASQLRTALGPIASGWRLIALGVLLTVLAVLAAVRIAALGNGSMRSTAGSDAERWLPMLLTLVVPVWFLISGLLNRLPRHLLAGLVGAAGAVAGPLLGLAWRDSLARAAGVMGVVLIVDGGIARYRFCSSV